MQQPTEKAHCGDATTHRNARAHLSDDAHLPNQSRGDDFFVLILLCLLPRLLPIHAPLRVHEGIFACTRRLFRYGLPIAPAAYASCARRETFFTL